MQKAKPPGFLLGLEGWGTPTTQEIDMSPMSPTSFCLKNVDFVIFKQFLAILSKYPHKSIPFGKH